LLHNIEGGPILRKLKHLPPSLDEIAPKFISAQDESKHGEQLQQDLELSHLDPHIQEKIYMFVKKYWSVFDKKGDIFILVKNYECVINTGNDPPIAVKKILYGPEETAIMRGCIVALEKVGHIQRFMMAIGYLRLFWLQNHIKSCTRHWQICMEVLRKLNTPQLRHKNNCLPHPTV
jgi:hypothetical protein